MTANGTTTDYDLYAEVNDRKEIELSKSAGDVVVFDKLRFVEFLVTWALLVAFCVGLVTAAKHTATTIDLQFRSPSSVPFPPGQRRQGLLLAAPSIIVYFLALLAFWPGQMSPDSIEEWRAATAGELSDSHTALHAAFVWSVVRIWPSPALAVGIQALLLGLAIGFTLAELRNWGVSLKALRSVSFAVALWPANYLMATVLWKDVLFAGVAVLLLIACLILVRTRGAALASRKFGLFLVVAVLGASLSRHNMLPLAFVFPILLATLYRNLPWSRLACVAAPMVLLPLVLKFVILPVSGIPTLGNHYRAINAMHVIGAYARAHTISAKEDLELVESVMPLSLWDKKYDCESVVPLFFEKQTNLNALGASYTKFNRLALALIFSAPAVFFEHQACVTGMLWKMLPRGQNYIGLVPMEISQMPEATALGLVFQPKLPGLTATVRQIFEFTTKSSQVWLFWRPALPLILMSILVIALMLSMRRWDVGLLALPAWLNTASLAVLIGSPDFRYQFAVVMIALLLLPLLLVKPQRSDGT